MIVTASVIATAKGLYNLAEARAARVTRGGYPKDLVIQSQEQAAAAYQNYKRLERHEGEEIIPSKLSVLA